MLDHPDPHELTGAYALHALSPDEEAAFEVHLVTCADCRAEVAELEAVAALLADDAVAPPPGLRSELLARIATTPQEPRHPSREATAAPASAGAETGGGETSPPVVPLRAAPPGPAASDTGDGAGARGRRWQQAVLAPAAAVLAIAAVGLSWWVADQSATIADLTQRLEAVEASSMEVAELVASDDLQTWNVTGADGSTVRLVYSPRQGQGWLLADGMAPAPAGSTYELWLIDDDGATPAGVFDATEAGVVAHPVTSDVMSVPTLGVTLEPAGGSPAPTSEPIMMIDM